MILITWHGQFDGGPKSNWINNFHIDNKGGDNYFEWFGFKITLMDL